MCYNPLELTKLCCNVIVKNIYSENLDIFNDRLLKLGLPNDVNKLILERYDLIKHITKFNN